MDSTVPRPPRHVIDIIHAANPGASSWLAICDAIAFDARGVGAVMLPFDPKLRARGLLASAALQSSLKAYVEEGWHLNDFRQAGVPVLLEQGYVLDTDIATRQQMETHPYYARFLKGQGLGGFCGIHFCVGDADWAFSIQLPSDLLTPEPNFIAGIPVLRQALSEAATRCEVEVRATWADFAATLAQIGIGCVAIDALGVALEVSGKASELLGKAGLVWQPGSPPPSASMIGDPPWLGGGIGPFPRQVATVAESDMTRAGISAFFAALPATLDFFAWPVRGIVLFQLTGPAEPPVNKLARRYGLTRTETSIVEGLASGLTVAQTAKVNGVTVGTLRQQLKSIYRKTGVGAQHQLVALIYQ